MTIAERKAREAYDRVNPWRPIRQAIDELPGTVCELRFTDALGGVADFGLSRFFFEDDEWWCIAPAKTVSQRLVEYRPTGETISQGKRDLIMLRARDAFVRTTDDGRVEHYEYRGGRLLPKPKSYKLYWRADD